MVLIAPPARAEVDIPVIGRPSTFYDAAGKDVKLVVSAEPVSLTLDDTIHLTVRVVNLLNPESVQRPDLSQITTFQRDFQIEEEPTTEPEPTGTRIFHYRLRPRHLNIKAIPGLVFPYYDPNLPQPADQPEYPFRRARSEPISIQVRKAAPPVLPAEPLEVPAFAMTLAKPSPRVPAWLWWLAGALPPLIAVIWCVVWRMMNPVGDRLVRRRRSRAARSALRALRHSHGEPATIVETVAIYLAERYDFPAIYRTPNELADHLRMAGASDELIAECVRFLRDADAARFSPVGGSTDVLLADADRLIRRLEEEG